MLWNSTRRDAGEVRCCGSTTKHALTELGGLPYASSAAWNEVWAGHHDVLPRHLRFGGQVTIESVFPGEGLIRVKTVWDAAPVSSK